MALISSLASPQRFLAILAQAEAEWVLVSLVGALYAQALRRRSQVRVAAALSTAALGWPSRLWYLPPTDGQAKDWSDSQGDEGSDRNLPRQQPRHFRDTRHRWPGLLFRPGRGVGAFPAPWMADLGRSPGTVALQQ